jgi:hypothetical protein
LEILNHGLSPIGRAQAPTRQPPRWGLEEMFVGGRATGSLARVKQQLLKPIAVIGLLLASHPLWVIFALHCYAHHASLVIGHWPSYNNPDPKNLGFDYEHLTVGLALMTLPLTGPIMIAITLWGHLRKKNPPVWLILSVGAVSWTIWGFYWRYDPAGLIGWYFD